MRERDDRKMRKNEDIERVEERQNNRKRMTKKETVKGYEVNERTK